MSATSNIIPFTFGEREVRVVMDEAGEPWWLASEVCAVLGFGNPRQALSDGVDDEDRNTVRIADGIPGNPNKTVINESGLYSLIMGSRKAEAKAFKRWVTSEVLPSIRKTGSYGDPAPADQSLALVKEEAEAVAGLCALYGVKGNQALIRADQVVRQRHGVSPMEVVGITHLKSETGHVALTPTEIGKAVEPAMSARLVNSMLADMGLQTKDGTKWRPTEAGESLAIVMDTGKKHSDGAPVTQLKWGHPTIKRICDWIQRGAA